MNESENLWDALHPSFSLPKNELPKITPLSHWLSGDATFVALKKAVDELVASATEDYDGSFKHSTSPSGKSAISNRIPFFLAVSTKKDIIPL